MIQPRQSNHCIAGFDLLSKNLVGLAEQDEDVSEKQAQ